MNCPGEVERNDHRRRRVGAPSCLGSSRYRGQAPQICATGKSEPVGRISDSVIRRYGRRIGGLRLRLNPPYGLAFEAYGLILLPPSGPRIGLMKVREVRNESVFGARLVGE